jgi:hypothetical protein
MQWAAATELEGRGGIGRLILKLGMQKRDFYRDLERAAEWMARRLQDRGEKIEPAGDREPLEIPADKIRRAA